MNAKQFNDGRKPYWAQSLLDLFSIFVLSTHHSSHHHEHLAH